MLKFTWLQTYSGKKFDYANPTPDMIDIRDIARALSRIPRFMAHTNIPVYVAEHCMYVADNLPEELKLEGLLHDAAEAYTGDIPAPLKALLGSGFKHIERGIEKAIAERFGLSYPWSQRIKDVDSHALYEEAKAYFPKGCIEDWHLHFETPMRLDNARIVAKATGNNPNAAKITEEFRTMAAHLMLKRNVKP